MYTRISKERRIIRAARRFNQFMVVQPRWPTSPNPPALGEKHLQIRQFWRQAGPGAAARKSAADDGRL
jgi:hypothetical protein